MTDAQLNALGPALATFLTRFETRFRSAPTLGHLRTYARGLLSDLPRKTVEPIALAAGTPVRTLQEFLKDHLWDHDGLGHDVRTHVARLLTTLPGDDLGTVGLLDETSAAKKGNKTPGVSRQYLGCLGKVDDGIVTIHLGVCRGTYKTLLDADLFLPERWSSDRKRCREAGIADEVVHRPKWEIALEQLDRARTAGVTLDWLTFDSEYGRCPEFLYQLDRRAQPFAGDCPRSFRCLAATTSPRRPERTTKGREAEQVVRDASGFRGQPWTVLRLKRQTAEDHLWRAKRARVWISGEGGWSERTYWLVWLSSEQTGEEAFVVSNAGEDCPLERVVRVAFARGHVEHAFRICKGELGFTHFEGRNYVALMRHLGLCVATMAFVAEHTQRLRGEKSAGDGGAGVPGLGSADPGVAGPGTRQRRSGMGVEGHRLPPETQQGRHGIQTETCRPATPTQKTSKTKTKTPHSFKVAL